MMRCLVMASSKGSVKPRSKSTLPPRQNKSQTRLLSGGGKGKNPSSTLVSDFQKLSLSEKQSARPKKSSQTSFGSRPRFVSSGSWTNHFKSEGDVAKFIKSGHARKIVVCAGAGISTGSGIPDFRTPGSGLYDNLQKYQIPYPEAIFDIDYFREDPKPFFELAKELYPSGKYRPNFNHYFLRMLHDREQLLRIYTQNIDGLERLAGIPAQKLVEAHGTFATATCTLCGQKHEGEEIKPSIFADKIPKCKVRVCPGVVKPDIVFFGEDLPRRFYLYLKDMLVADLVIIMGTSLEVQPFAGIIDVVRYNVPRLLFNMEAVGPFRRKKRPHDFVITGDLIESVQTFVKTLEWETEMEELIEQTEGQKQAWLDDKDVSSQKKPPCGENTKGDKSSLLSQNSNGNSSPTRRRFHSMALNSAKSEGHRSKVFVRPKAQEVSRGRGGLFPKLPSNSRFTKYQESSSSSTSDSSQTTDSSEDDR